MTNLVPRMWYEMITAIHEISCFTYTAARHCITALVLIEGVRRAAVGVRPNALLTLQLYATPPTIMSTEPLPLAAAAADRLGARTTNSAGTPRFWSVIRDSARCNVYKCNHFSGICLHCL